MEPKPSAETMLFSYYEDTIEWIYEYLESVVRKDEKLSCYEGRIAAVSGESSKYDVTREEAVHGFAPNSGDAPPDATDEFDILIATYSGKVSIFRKHEM